MTKEMEKKLEELMKDESFVENVMQTESVEGIQQLLKEQEIDMSIDEINTSIAEGKKALEENGYTTNGDELTEKGLELVTGGGRGMLAFGAACLGVAGFALMWSVAPVGAVAMGVAVGCGALRRRLR